MLPPVPPTFRRRSDVQRVLPLNAASTQARTLGRISPTDGCGSPGVRDTVRLSRASLMSSEQWISHTRYFARSKGQKKRSSRLLSSCMLGLN